MQRPQTEDRRIQQRQFTSKSDAERRSVQRHRRRSFVSESGFASAARDRLHGTISRSADSLTVEIPSDTQSDDSTCPTDRRVSSGFFDVLTGQPSSAVLQAHGPQVHSDYFCVDEQLDWRNVPKMVEELDKARGEKQRAEVVRVLHMKTLPYLAKSEDFDALSTFLSVNDEQVQDDAGAWIEIKLLTLQRSGDVSVRNKLLSVSTKSWTAFIQQSQDSGQIERLVNVHLMAMSALLTRCPRPTPEQLVTQKEPTRMTHRSLKQAMLLALQAFHDSYRGQLQDPAAFPALENMDIKQRKPYLSHLTFCQQTVHAFTMLNQLMVEGWSAHGITLLDGLRELLESTAQDTRKPSLYKDVRAAFEYLVIRGLAVLLRTKFTNVATMVGSWKMDHSQLMAKLITDLLKKTNNLLKNEVSDLAFHDAVNKTEIFQALLQGVERVLEHPALAYMERKLQLIAFRTHKARSALFEGQKEKGDTFCKWRKKHCYSGQFQVSVAFYQRSANCLDRYKLHECLNQDKCASKPNQNQAASERESTQFHQKNMNRLAELSPKCKQIIKLIAYQLGPFPFYITEYVEGRRLLMYLLDHRNARRWLDTPILCRVALQVVEILRFLAGEFLVVPDITAYNLVVHSSQQNQGMPMCSRCNVLTSGDVTIKLVDVGLAHKYQNNDQSWKPIPVLEHGPIPVRWTAPEALFEGLYTEKSMVYSLGCVMYELWTHGCWPFTSYDMTTEDLLIRMKVKAGGMCLHHWPCIPEDVFNLITDFTSFKHEARPNLRDAETCLRTASKMKRSGEKSKPLLEAAKEFDQKFPEPSSAQIKREHVPELGIPFSVKQLNEAGRMAEYYRNTRSHAVTYDYSKDVPVTEKELYRKDWIDLDNLPHVKELVTRTFVQDVLPSLIASSPPHVTCWRSRGTGEKTESRNGMDFDFGTGDFVVDVREYKPCKSLKNESKRNILWMGQKYSATKSGQGDISSRVLHVILSLAQAVLELHERGFCHCDIRAANVLIDSFSGEVVLVRIGRIQRVSSHGTVLVDLAELEDSFRWLAPEVLIDRHCGLKNDIFMLGTAIWEIFWIRDVTRRHPSPTDKHFVPYTNIPKDKVLEVVRDGEPLSRPADCPRWLYELILKCRSLDPNQRPSCQEVVADVKAHVGSYRPLEPFFNEGAEAVYSELTPEAPQVPPRSSNSVAGAVLQRKTLDNTASINKDDRSTSRYQQRSEVSHDDDFLDEGYPGRDEPKRSFWDRGDKVISEQTFRRGLLPHQQDFEYRHSQREVLLFRKVTGPQTEAPKSRMLSGRNFDISKCHFDARKKEEEGESDTWLSFFTGDGEEKVHIPEPDYDTEEDGGSDLSSMYSFKMENASPFLLPAINEYGEDHELLLHPRDAFNPLFENESKDEGESLYDRLESSSKTSS